MFIDESGDHLYGKKLGHLLQASTLAIKQRISYFIFFVFLLWKNVPWTSSG